MTGKKCAVASCKSNSTTAKRTGQHISFFRFPKDVKQRNEWIRRCYRQDEFDPSHRRICSKHFEEEDFEDIVKASLLNQLPNKLKPGVLPTQHLLPEVFEVSQESPRRQRLQKTEFVEVLQPEPSTSFNPEDICEQSESIIIEVTAESPNHYDTIIEENENLKEQLREKENSLKVMEQENIQLRKNIENYVKDFNETAKIKFGHIFTSNQIDIMLGKKTGTHWTYKEIANAFKLKWLSNRAYTYMRQKLHYPLPAPSTLQNWAMNNKYRKRKYAKLR